MFKIIYNMYSICYISCILYFYSIIINIIIYTIYSIYIWPLYIYIHTYIYIAYNRIWNEISLSRCREKWNWRPPKRWRARPWPEIQRFSRWTEMFFPLVRPIPILFSVNTCCSWFVSCFCSWYVRWSTSCCLPVLCVVFIMVFIKMLQVIPS